MPTFGVVFAADRKFWHHLSAAIASVRVQTPMTPISVYSDALPPRAEEVLRALDVEVEAVDVSPLEGAHSLWPGNDYLIMKSRYLKTVALARSNFGSVLYLDSDVLVNNAPSNIQRELESNHIWMLRHPGILDLKAVTERYLRRREDLFLRATLNLAHDAKPSFPLWNSGVIYGSGRLVNQLGHEWNARLLAALVSQKAATLMKPSDQLSLWATLAVCNLSVRALPPEWNTIPPGLGVFGSEATGAHVLHFEKHKNSKQARFMRASAIAQHRTLATIRPSGRS